MKGTPYHGKSEEKENDRLVPQPPRKETLNPESMNILVARQKFQQILVPIQHPCNDIHFFIVKTFLSFSFFLTFFFLIVPDQKWYLEWNSSHIALGIPFVVHYPYLPLSWWLESAALAAFRKPERLGDNVPLKPTFSRHQPVTHKRWCINIPNPKSSFDEIAMRYIFYWLPTFS